MDNWSSISSLYATDAMKVSSEQRTRWVELPCTQQFIYLAVHPVKQDIDLFLRYPKELPALLVNSGRVRGLYWLVQQIKHLDSGVMLSSRDLVANETGIESIVYFDLRGVIQGAVSRGVTLEDILEWRDHPCTRLLVLRVAELLENLWFDQVRDLVVLDPFSAADRQSVQQRYHWTRCGVVSFANETLDIYESYEELAM